MRHPPRLRLAVMQTPSVVTPVAVPIRSAEEELAIHSVAMLVVAQIHSEAEVTPVLLGAEQIRSAAEAPVKIPSAETRSATSHGTKRRKRIEAAIERDSIAAFFVPYSIRI